MNVIIAPAAIVDNAWRETIQNALKKYFIEVCAHIEYDLSGLDNIYCSASEDGFYSDVRSLQTEKGIPIAITDSGTYRAVAKTISYDVNGIRQSSIVLSDFIWPGIVNHVFAFETNEAHDLPLFNYVTAHEFGHCRDNFFRHQNLDDRLPSGLNYHALNNYYSSILISEYFACLFSAPALETSVMEGMVQNLANDKENFRTQTHARLNSYRSDETTLHEIASQTAGIVWVILIQYAKIVGSIHGGYVKDLNSIAWIGASEATRDILLMVGEILHNAISAYPNIEISEKLAEAWYQLSYAFGFQFEQDGRGCSVFFDDDSAVVW